jgi:hypothetical protein
MRRILIAIICCSLCVFGCEEYVATETAPITGVQRDYILAFVLDTSGSFLPQLFGGKERGYRFFTKASELFFRNRTGEHDRILISQLSASDRTLLWEGAPLLLQRRFGNAEQLKKFIYENSDMHGSRVYAALADTLGYINELPGVKEGKTKVCVIVLSDMLDTTQQPEDRQRMIESLSHFAKINASVGLYWVDQSCLQDCRQLLTDAGLKDFVVESDIVEDPKLPFSEQLISSN